MLRSVAFAALAAAVQAKLTFSRSTTFYFDQSVDTTLKPIAHAVKDVSRDFYKIVGATPLTTSSPPTAWNADSLVMVYIDPSLGRERFTLVAGNNSLYSYLNVTGGDVRGLVFGMYHLSNDILGVDPFWWFYDLQPAYAGTITVPLAYNYDSGNPVFYSRGAFFNDEDISGFFFTDPSGDGVYSAHAAEMYAETLLRLRINTVIPSTFAYIDEAHYRAYQNRGLMFGNHHVMPCGSNYYAWPMGVPYTYRLNPQPLLDLWTHTMNYQQNVAGREMMYSVGYRGLNDYPFWNDDVDCNTDQCRGETISYAIANQTIIAKSLPVANGTAPPRFVTYLWMELLELRQAGTLVVPEGVSLIWTDFPGSFNIQGAVNASAGDGFYAHIQMMSGTAGQLSEFVKIERAFANMWLFYDKNATSYGMINLSDLKNVPLTAEAVFRYMWNPLAFNQTMAGCPAPKGMEVRPEDRSGSRRVGPRGPVGYWPMPEPECELRVTPWEAQDAFILEFTTRHYGSPSNMTVAQAVANIHGTYFNASYMSIDEACTSVGSCNLGDHYFGSTLRNLLGPYENAVDSNTKPQSLVATAQGLAQFAATNLPYMEALWTNQVVPLQQYIPAGNPLSFYNAHVMMQVSLHYFHIKAFATLSASAIAYVGGDMASAIANATQALQAMDNVLDYNRLGEGAGIWRGVYSQEYWTWCQGTRQTVAHLLLHLQGLHGPAAPQSIYPDYAFMTYECPLHDATLCNTFPLSAFNATIAWDVMPRIVCADNVPPAVYEQQQAGIDKVRYMREAAAEAGASCTTTLMGASYNGTSADLVMFLATNPLRGNVPPPLLRYTTDNTPVLPTSQVYLGPITVTGNATVRARSFDALTGTALLSESLAVITQVAA